MSADLLLGLPAKVKLLLERLTATRATNLDNLSNLNTTVSSRAPASDTGTLLGRLTQPRADKLDLIPNLNPFGPPTGEMSFAEWASREGTTIPVGPANVTVLPQSESYVELLSLSGPAVIYYLGIYCNIPTKTPPVVTITEFEIDGVVVTPSGGIVYSAGSIGNKILSLVGMHVDNSSLHGNSYLAFQPIVFNTNLVVRLKHNYPTGTLTYTTLHRHMPI